MNKEYAILSNAKNYILQKSRNLLDNPLTTHLEHLEL